MDARPDLIEHWKADGYKWSTHRLAIEAGILPKIDAEDVAIERLMLAWLRADQSSREVFLALIEDWEDRPDRRPGPTAKIHRDAPDVLLKLRDKMPMSDLANALSVSRETVRRWCAGEAQPRTKHLSAMRAMVKDVP